MAMSQNSVVPKMGFGFLLASLSNSSKMGAHPQKGVIALFASVVCDRRARAALLGVLGDGLKIPANPSGLAVCPSGNSRQLVQ